MDSPPTRGMTGVGDGEGRGGGNDGVGAAPNQYGVTFGDGFRYIYVTAVPKRAPSLKLRPGLDKRFHYVMILTNHACNQARWVLFVKKSRPDSSGLIIKKRKVVML